MTHVQPSSAKQFVVIEDLFKAELEEKAILRKNKLSRKLYDRRLADETFTGQLDRRLTWEYRRSEFILARCTRVAVSNLVRLTECNEPETARKACLDMITMRTNHSSISSTKRGYNLTVQHESQIPSSETTGKLLVFLAEKNN